MTREQACFHILGMSLAACYLKMAWIMAEFLAALASRDDLRLEELKPTIYELAGIRQALMTYPVGLLGPVAVAVAA